MFFVPLVVALTITPAQSLKLAQTTMTQQKSTKASDIKKAKDDLQNKINQLSKSTVRGVSKLVARLNAYMTYLSYLEANLSTQSSADFSAKLDKIASAADNIVKVANDVISAGGADVDIGTSTISDTNFDSVATADMGLAYTPVSGAVTSGQISSGGSSTGGAGTGGGDSGGGSTGGGDIGTGDSGGGTPQSPSP